MNDFLPGRFYHVRPDALTVHQNHPRKTFQEEAMQELKASILEHGILQSVIFTEISGRLIVVAGARRVTAAVEAGLETIVAKFVGYYNLEVALVENLQREDLSVMERAEALLMLKEKNQYDLEQLSKVVSRSVSTLCEILALNRFPDDIRAECRGDSRYAQRRLVEIARASTQQEMRVLFEEYKDELNGVFKVDCAGVRNKTTLYDRVINHVTSATKSLKNIGLSTISTDELQHLIRILDEFERVIREKMSTYEH